MKITKLKLFNFKNFEEKEFEFDDHNLITGSNGSGKSTIKDAIIFCLYNKTPEGSSADTSKFIKNGKMKCTVEIDFEVDGETYKIKRERTNKNSRITFLDGSQSEEDSGITQRELDSLIPPFEIFQNVFNIRFFMSLPDRDKRKFILDHTEQIDKLKLFKTIIGEKADDLIEKYNLSFDDLNIVHKRLLTEKRFANTELDRTNTIINDSTEIEVPSFDKNELDKLEQDFRDTKVIIDKVNENKNAWSIYELKIQNNDAIERRNESIRKEINSIVIEDLRKPDQRKLNNLLIKKNEIKKKISIPEGKCPLCLQDINPTHKNKIDEINDKNVAVAEEIENEYNNEKDAYNKALQAFNKNVEKINRKKTLENQIVEIEEVVAPSERMETLSSGGTEKELLQARADEVAYNIAKRNEEERLEKIRKLKELREVLVKKIEDYTALIKVFSPKGMPAEEMRIKLEPVITLFNKFIPDSKIKTLQILKNELDYKEVFKVYIKDKEYSKMSLGEKTLVDIALSRIIDNLTGDIVGVYFLDNAEVVDKEPKIENQAFIAKVTNEELKINNK